MAMTNSSVIMDNFSLFNDVDFSDLLFDSDELNEQCNESILDDLGLFNDNCFADTNLNILSEDNHESPLLIEEIAESFLDYDISDQIQTMNHVNDIAMETSECKDQITPLNKKNQATKRKIIVTKISKKQELARETFEVKGVPCYAPLIESSEEIDVGCEFTSLKNSTNMKQQDNTLANVKIETATKKGTLNQQNMASKGINAQFKTYNQVKGNVANQGAVRKIQIVHPPIARQATKVRILIGGNKATEELMKKRNLLLNSQTSQTYLPPSPPNSDIELSPRQPSSVITDISSPAMLVGGVLKLSEEEKRTLISEGFHIPTRLPLNKQEERALKRVQRKIKNKMSAQESRRKKKNYLESLEQRLDFTNEENGRLKQKLVTLENNNKTLLSQLKHAQELLSNCSKSTKTILMNVIVFFAVFAGVLNIDFSSMAPKEAVTNNNDYATTTKPSRVLLSINEESESKNYKSDWSFLWTCKEGPSDHASYLHHDHDYYNDMGDYLEYEVGGDSKEVIEGFDSPIESGFNDSNYWMKDDGKDDWDSRGDSDNDDSDHRACEDDQQSLELQLGREMQDFGSGAELMDEFQFTGSSDGSYLVEKIKVGKDIIHLGSAGNSLDGIKMESDDAAFTVGNDLMGVKAGNKMQNRSSVLVDDFCVEPSVKEDKSVLANELKGSGLGNKSISYSLEKGIEGNLFKGDANELFRGKNGNSFTGDKAIKSVMLQKYNSKPCKAANSRIKKIKPDKSFGSNSTIEIKKEDDKAEMKNRAIAVNDLNMIANSKTTGSFDILNASFQNVNKNSEQGLNLVASVGHDMDWIS